MFEGYGRRRNEAHTVSSIPRPVCIAYAGGNGYRKEVRDVEHATGELGYTMVKCRPRASEAETLERTDTTLLSDLMILSLSPNSLKVRAFS